MYEPKGCVEKIIKLICGKSIVVINCSCSLAVERFLQSTVVRYAQKKNTSLQGCTLSDHYFILGWSMVCLVLLLFHV